MEGKTGLKMAAVSKSGFCAVDINYYVSGLKNDISAVKNAIILQFNNGLAEGSVNKLKVIKRIMYGRCSFKLLKFKLLRLELQKIN